jgi:hypothetical protein
VAAEPDDSETGFRLATLGILLGGALGASAMELTTLTWTGAADGDAFNSGYSANHFGDGVTDSPRSIPTLFRS